MPIILRPKSFWVWATVLGLSLAPYLAQAQDRDPGAAQALFDQGRQLVKQGKFTDACPKFLESNRLDPGIGTQFHLADCYEQAGRVASAWATFLDVASQARAAGQLDREKAAQKRADKLEPRLPRLLLNVPDASRVPDLVVRRNGVVIGEAQWGTPVAVDPGEIEILAAATGKRTLKQNLRLEEGKTASFDLPALADEAAPAVRPAAPAKAAEEAEEVDDEEEGSAQEDKAESSGPGPLFYTLAAAGAVGLGIGGGFALMARSTNEESKQHCDPQNPNLCSSQGVQLREDAIAQGNIATVGVIAGGAALTGAVLVLALGGGSSEKPGEKQARLRSSAAIGPRQGVVYLHGSF